VVMAPLTRLRAGEDGVPNQLMTEYYAQRATNGGLLLAEATNISPSAAGYFGAPGLFRGVQVEGWKAVTSAVHAKGGKIFVQLWHTGRMSHPDNQPGGETPVAPSVTDMQHLTSGAVTRSGRQPYVAPRELSVKEITGIVNDYKMAARNAISAGFDGVELHAANGYLPEQFLCTSANNRTDEYGGSIENRARFTFEALEAILSVVESSKVGIRVSPFSAAYSCTDATPAETYSHVVKRLNDYDLSFLHLVEPRGFQPADEHVPEEGVTRFFRPMYDGKLMSASGYEREEAIRIVEDGFADCVAFGRSFIANPDLVHRLEVDAPLNHWNPRTSFCADGAPPSAGYTDYPALVRTRVVH
jgi:N-ethylmaleimide reductase